MGLSVAVTPDGDSSPEERLELLFIATQQHDVAARNDGNSDRSGDLPIGIGILSTESPRDAAKNLFSRALYKYG